MTLATSGAAVQEFTQHQRLDALKSLSIEELASLDVTTAGRRLQSIAAVAAAVSVITSEDIRRNAATSLVESLRMADGLQVARFDGRTWAVSARGFNISTSNKMLTMMDGRSLWTPLFSGVLWDEHDALMGDIDRIEVVRGPGGTLWGANAINGVINIVTRPATDTLGTYGYVGAGTEERLVAAVRHGRAVGANGAWRAYAKVSVADGQRFANGEDAEDDTTRVLAGGRADWTRGDDAFVVQSDAYAGRIGLFDRDDTDIHGAYLRGRWTRTFTETSSLQLQGAVDYSSRRVPLQFEEHRASAQIDLQHRVVAGRHDVMSGANADFTIDETVPSEVLHFDPNDRSLALASVFVQDEIAILPGRFWITPGLRLLKNSYTGIESHPGIRARWKPTSAQTVWAAVSRAVRLPSRFDRDLRFTGTTGRVVVAGSDDFMAETVIAFEGGYRAQLTPRVSFDVSLFSNDYDHLRSQAPGGAVAFAVISNELNGRSKGIEAGVTAQPAPWLRAHASYTRLATSTTVDSGKIDLGGGIAEFNDPDHQAALRVYTDLPRGLELDAFLRYVSELPHPLVPAYGELDARFGWVSARGHEFAIVGRNLLHDQHPEFNGPGFRRYEFERTVLLRSTWRF